MKNRFKVRVTLIAIIQSLLAACERFVITAIGIAKRLHSFTFVGLGIALLSTASHTTFAATSTTELRTIIYGVEDFFDTSNGPEVAPISNGLQVHLGDAVLANLDDFSTNKSRGFSFDLSSLTGSITGAVIKLRARPLDDERAEGNDEIYLSGFDETGNNLMPAYTIGLGVDSPPNNYFDFDWQIDGRPAHPAEGYEIVIDLADFAAKEGSGLSLIEDINSFGLLDMVVGDDTNVDYVSLEVSVSDSGGSNEHISERLVAYFPMNGDAQDLSGNGNHASQSLPSASDRFGDSAGSLSFNGNSNLETLYSPTQHVGNEFSIGLWLRLEVCAPQGMAVILAKASRLDSERGETRGNDEFLLALNHPNYQGSEECSVTVGTAEGPQDFVYSQPEWGNATFASNPLQIDYGSWMHLMVVVRPDGASFYKNGASIGDVTLDFSLPQSFDNVPMKIGSGIGDSGPSRHQFFGEMDDLIVFDRALTAAEVSTIFDGTSDDSDGDGVPDWLDVFPGDAEEQFDTDGDGIGNIDDSDDDADGVADTEDYYYWDPARTVADPAVCANQYCVETTQEYDQPILAYHYALTDQMEGFSFDAYGRAPVASFLAAGGEPNSFNFGDPAQTISMNEFYAGDLSNFTQYLENASQQLELSADGGVFFDLGSANDGDATGEMQMYLRNFGGDSVDNYAQTNFHLRLTRPKRGLYTAENVGANCWGYDPSAIAGLPGTNDGISLFGVADSGIPSGAYGALNLTTGTSIVPSQRRQYRPRSGGTGVRVCSSTPPGIYADTFIALDGRGDHRAYRYTVEVAIAPTETGSATWYANKTDAPTDQPIFDELAQGLVTHLTFDGTRINSAPRDNYGVTYSAIFDGGTQYVQGPLAQAVTGQVEIPDGDWPSALRDGAYSISFWARLGAEANCGGSAANNVLLKLGEENGGIVFKTGCNQNDGNTEYSGWVLGLHAHQLPAQETWHHYVVTADAENNVRLYIDGVEGPNGTAAARNIPGGASLLLGPLEEGCDCAIDDFRIYDRQLDQSTVSQLFGLGGGESAITTEPIGSCTSNYCSESETEIQYVYRLQDFLEPFPYAEVHKRDPIRLAGGLVGGSFAYGPGETPFFTECNGDYIANTCPGQLANQELVLTNYIIESTGEIELRTNGETGNSLASDEAQGLRKKVKVHLQNWGGELITSDINQINTVATIVRPENELGETWSNQCTAFVADQVFRGLDPLGGIWMSFLYEPNGAPYPPQSKDGNSFLICSSTTPGTYQLSIEALDGRGGKVQADFTLVVAEEQQGSGAIYWGESGAVGLEQGLLLHLPFDGDSMNRAPGGLPFSADVQEGASYVTGARGEALKGAALVTRENMPVEVFDGDYSVAMWVKRENPCSGDYFLEYRPLEYVGGPPTIGDGLGMIGGCIDGDESTAYVVWGYNRDPQAKAPPPAGDGWHHYVGIVRASGYLELYIDGALVDQIQEPKDQLDLTGPLQIGSWYYGCNCEFDDLRMYNRALSDVEIQALSQVGDYDTDGDGIPDELDAFPFDPSASVDTDGDGMPDDWNVGYGQSDSTSVPPLQLDFDDDNDGYPDYLDPAPKDPNVPGFGLSNCKDCPSELDPVWVQVAEDIMPLDGQGAEGAEVRISDDGLRISSGAGPRPGLVRVFDLVDGSGERLFESFDTPAPDLTAVLDQYPLWDTVRDSSIWVEGGRLVATQNGGREGQDGLVLKKLVAGDTKISALLGRSSTNGDYHVGIRVGNSIVLFHPGLGSDGDGGDFRVETWEGETEINRPANIKLGFLPAANVMHRMELDIDASTGEVDVVITDGENDENKFFYTFTDLSLMEPFQVRLITKGNQNAGLVFFDNLSINTSQGEFGVFEPNVSIVQKGQTLEGSDFYFQSALSATGSVVAVGATWNSQVGARAGMASVYSWDNNQWVQRGNSFFGDADYDRTGARIDLNNEGNVVAIGSSQTIGVGPEAVGPGYVEVYEWTGSTWQIRGNRFNGDNLGDWANYAYLDGSGDLLAIGEAGYDGEGVDRGRVRIFRWDGSEWNQVGTALTGDVDGERLGDRAAQLSDGGTRIFVAGRKNGRIYDWNGEDWQLRHGFENWGIDFSSASLSEDGNTVALAVTPDGAPSEVRIFRGQGDSWDQIGTVGGLNDEDRIGYPIDLDASGNRLIIGGPYSDVYGTDRGVTRVYEYFQQMYPQVCTTEAVLCIDSDNDGIFDNAVYGPIDAFPLDPAASVDTDGDGKPDDWNLRRVASDSISGLELDEDDDNDGVMDWEDDLPLDPHESRDFDGDGVGNLADSDDDNDGVSDLLDAFPFDAANSTDSDGDGVGDTWDVAPLDSSSQSLLVTDAIAGLEDAALRACVQGIVDSASYQLVYASDVTEINCSFDGPGSIKTFDGIQAFYNLRRLDLAEGAPSSLEPLSVLTDLQYFATHNANAELSDLSPLAQLYRLQSVNLNEVPNLTGEALNAISHLTQLRYLGLTNVDSADFLVNFQRLTFLLLARTDIQDYSAIDHLRRLQSLYIYDGTHPLSNLDMIRGLTDLGFVSISRMGVSDAYGAQHLDNLYTLELVGNELASIDAFTTLSQLSNLVLTWNNIPRIGDAFADWRNGTVITLTGSPITCADLANARLNDDIVIQFDSACLEDERLTLAEALTNVEDANLRACIQALNPTAQFADEVELIGRRDGTNDQPTRDCDEVFTLAGVEQFVNLKVLALEFPRFDDISALSGLYELEIVMLNNAQPMQSLLPLANKSKLRYLQLEQNYDSEVIKTLSSLEELAILYTYPLEIGDLSGLANLRRIWICCSEIVGAGSLEQLTQLQSLELAGADVDDMGAVMRMTWLEGLALEYMQIADIGFLGGFLDLRVLNLSGNQISDLSVLSGLGKLETIILDNNFVSDIRPITDLTALQLLELENNPIKVLYGVFNGWTTELHVDLSGTLVLCSEVQAITNPLVTIQLDSGCIEGSPDGDGDGDGMPDEWEEVYGFDPSDAKDAYLDPDQDGYLNWEEYLNGTDPFVSDGLSQIVSTERPATLRPESTGRLTLQYSTSDLNPNLSGLGLRIHFNSDYVNTVYVENVLEVGLISIGAAEPDTDDLDRDPETDSFILLAWAGLTGPEWPGAPLPADLLDVVIEARESISELDHYPIRFSASSTTEGYRLSAASIYNPVVLASLDVDGDGQAKALTDGLLVIRRLFGFSGDSLVSGAVGTSAQLTTAEDIADVIDVFSEAFDVDADGSTKALTDGLLIIRRLFGFSGQSLTNGAVGTNATRTNPDEIAAYIDSLIP